ncbi:MAG: ABC transporter substrate-binding protein [Haloferacaceae archaeon]
MSYDGTLDRRRLLKLSGTGLAAALAGCSGGGGEGGGEEDFMSAAQELGLSEGWRQRRIGTARNDWAMSDRPTGTPNADTWTNDSGFQSAVDAGVWSPPDGWEETAAGDVDTLTILNHGAANMEFDPATLAAHEMFTEVTGIELDVIEIGVEQATQREQQVLSSQEGSPQAFNVDGALVPEFVQQGYLELTDPLYPEGSFEPYIPALQNLVRWELDESHEGTHTYGYPNIAEASLGHLRPDLVEQQGLDPQAYVGSEWTWADLEELMKAFEGTDVFGYAYYAGDAVYLSYSFRELLYQQGGRMVQDDGTVKVDTDAAVRVIRKMRDWRDKGWVPGDVISYGEGNIVDLFTSGQLAFATGFSDFVPAAVDQYGADGSQYRPVVPPAADAGPAPTQAGLVDPNTTSINRFADTGHKLAAMLYGDLKLSYFTQWMEFTVEGNMSYMDSVYSDAAEAGATPYADVLGSAIENGVLELFPRMSSVFQQMLSPAQRAIQGEISPAEAMSQVQEFVDQEVN